MSLNKTPLSHRTHIGIFGQRNAGKSSVINALTGQQLAIVSDVKGTTTDPVSKAMELLPLGPVVLIDTAGLDDDSSLGQQRIKKTYDILNKTDIALLVIDHTIGVSSKDLELFELIKAKKIPLIIVFNKSDLSSSKKVDTAHMFTGYPSIYVSSTTNQGIFELKELLAKQLPQTKHQRVLVGDLIKANDFIVLVTPIDESAPKGRLILPQQQVIRDILDHNAIAITTKDDQLENTLKTLGKDPSLVITDSQVFSKVNKIVPKHIPLTSFSILFARFKGNLHQAIVGAEFINELQDNDHVLISEGCTHHRQCEDIGTVKIPRWISEFTHKNLVFEFTSGAEFPQDLSKYRLVIHCGGCTLNPAEMSHRLSVAKEQEIKMTNYGILISYINHILPRCTDMF